MKKVLIIGGTGTISSPIVRLLANQESVAVTLLNRGNRNTGIPANVQTLQGDMNDEMQIKDLIENLEFDVVINFIVFTPEQAKRDIRLFKGKTKQYILISTNAVLNHDLTCNVDETLEYGNSNSLYGQGKAAVERVFLGEPDFPITVVRPSQTYSEGRIPLSVKGKGYWPVIQRMLDGKEILVHGDGQSIWMSTHADDFARLFVSLVGNPSTLGEIYTIVNDTPHTWDMLYRELALQLGVAYKPVYVSSYLLAQSKQYDFKQSMLGDKHHSNIIDISKIRALNPDFEFEVDLKEGIRRFLEFMYDNPEYKETEPEFDLWCDRLIAALKEHEALIMNDL